MRRLTSERARWALAVAAGLAALIAAQVAWLAANRRGYPLLIDEAGYITIALRDHAALVHSGLGAFWDTVEHQPPQAPFVPALTALLYVIHTGVLDSFGVLCVFLVLLIGSVYAIAERFMGARAAALAALITATLPGVLEFTRTYVFALPSAALLAFAIYALLRSDGLRRTGWPVAAGVALGLLTLTRTVNVAFLPGIVLAGAVAVAVRDREGRIRSLRNGGLMLLIAAAVAAVWYVPNFQPVYDYLTRFGYGEQSHEYGQSTSVLTLRHWTAPAERTAAESVHLPSTLLIAAGLLCAAAVAAVRLRGPQRRVEAARILRSEVLLLAIILVVGYLALTTSSNAGFGFGLPLLPVAVIVALAGFRQVPALRTMVVAVVLAVAALNLAVAFDVSDGLSRPHFADIPVLREVPITDGRPFSISGLRDPLPGSQLHFTSADRKWLSADRTIAAYVLRYAREQRSGPILAFATRSPVTNTNTVGLASELWFGRYLPVAQLTVRDGGDNTAAYARYLDDPQHGQPNFLITSNTAAGDYIPHVSQIHAEAAARQLGFRKVWTTRLPDGRLFRLWWLKR